MPERVMLSSAIEMELLSAEEHCMMGAGPVHREVYPHGSVIEMGEQLTPDGPAPYISLAIPGREPSLTFYVDPLSAQPIMKIKTINGIRICPIDKIVRDPYYEGDKFNRLEDARELIRLNSRPPLLGRLLSWLTGRRAI